MNWALQVVFVLVGVLIVAGIIWDSRRHRAKNKRYASKESGQMRQRTPLPVEEEEADLFTGVHDANLLDKSFDEVVIVKKKPATPKQVKQPDEDVPDEVIAIHVMASPDQLFKG